VRELELLVGSIVQSLTETVECFSAGRISQFYEEWTQLTSDAEILNMVMGANIETDCDTDVLPLFIPNRSTPVQNLNEQEKIFVEKEIGKLLQLDVISTCEHIEGEVISPIFLRPKKDGTHRMILNLKKLNEEVTYHHFKMETLSTALLLVREGCFMASLDLKHAYYTVPVCEEHRKLLRFEWKGQLYEYNAWPNGLALAPRKFTKLLKPVFASLHLQGHISTAFLDDSLLIGDSRQKCMQNVLDTLDLLQRLGFVVHPTKSVLMPTKEMQYLGVIINSDNMTVTLTAERKHKLVQSCREIRNKHKISIRDLARVIGLIVASFPAVKYGPLHYRKLENVKKLALRASHGNFDREIALTEAGKRELDWWMHNTHTAYNDVCQSEPDIVICTDASSQKGWGALCLGVRSGGLWLPEEKEFHINYLELKAAFLGIKAFREQLEGKHVRLMADNTTAVSCINHMGTSHSEPCNDMTFQIWSWCIDRNIFLSAAYLPGAQNTAADEESRRVNTDAEWKLETTLLQSAFDVLDIQPNIDLFASRLNAQMQRYMSFRPDPDAEVVDAFSVSWKDFEFYAFPPFSVIPRVLRKVQRDESSGVLVVPDWPTQPWYPVLMKLLVLEPVRLPCRKNLLHLPSHPGQVHRLVQTKRLHLLVCKISGKIVQK
jgi:hypothetical protein